MVAQNREYKDRLFSFIFGTAGNEEWTLSLYNAVSGSDYRDPSAIEYTTIREVLYLGMHNDVSFLISGEMSLYEQQSTHNPNMPVRMLQYVGNLFERHITARKWNKYGRRLLPLPAPRLVVFYAGAAAQPDEEVLRLSDAFPEGAESDVEVRVRVVNVNPGRSAGLLGACRPLAEYSWLVGRVRENNGSGGSPGLAGAIDRSIDEMPGDFAIRDFLLEHRAEVRGMLLTEYDEARTLELFREEGRAEGRAEGAVRALDALVRDGVITLADAARRAGLAEDEFLDRAAGLGRAG